MPLLAIETTCDETAAAVIDRSRRVLSSVVASQDELHARWRGVVPELASRAHVERIVPVIDMRRRLGFAAPPPSAVRTHLVLRQQDDWYSLFVDEVLDVHDFPAERIEQPAKADGPATDAVTGVFAGPAGLVHFLDPQRIVQSLVRQRTAPFIRHGASHGG